MVSMDRKQYPSDLTEEQWAMLRPLLPGAKPDGRPHRVDLREVVNALLYVLRTGWSYFRLWRDDGMLERVHVDLRAQVRRAAGRDPQPSAGVIDAQSVKMFEKGGRATTMLARRFSGESATFSSIPWD